MEYAMSAMNVRLKNALLRYVDGFERLEVVGAYGVTAELDRGELQNSIMSGDLCNHLSLVGIGTSGFQLALAEPVCIGGVVYYEGCLFITGSGDITKLIQNTSGELVGTIRSLLHPGRTLSVKYMDCANHHMEDTDCVFDRLAALPHGTNMTYVAVPYPVLFVPGVTAPVATKTTPCDKTTDDAVPQNEWVSDEIALGTGDITTQDPHTGSDKPPELIDTIRDFFKLHFPDTSVSVNTGASMANVSMCKYFDNYFNPGFMSIVFVSGDVLGISFPNTDSCVHAIKMSLNTHGPDQESYVVASLDKLAVSIYNRHPRISVDHGNVGPGGTYGVSLTGNTPLNWLVDTQTAT